MKKIVLISLLLLLVLTIKTYSQEIPATIDNHGEMILIPGGKYIMGTNESEIENLIELLKGFPEWYILSYPKHNEEIKDFYIDKYEVTNAQFCEFLNEKGNEEEEKNIPYLEIGNRSCLIYQTSSGQFKTKEGYENYPVIMVSWYGANAYAKWAGKRLPTEGEWEKAARGPKGLFWPWGNKWDKEKCNNWNMKNKKLLDLMPDIYEQRGPLPVGSFPKGASPYGVMDMAGNAAEWCSEWYGLYPGYPYSTEENNGKANYKVTRGGSWGTNLPGGLICPFRSLHRKYMIDSYTGFRCVMDVK